jgi:hypothetical protein
MVCNETEYPPDAGNVEKTSAKLERSISLASLQDMEVSYNQQCGPLDGYRL